MGLGWTDEPVTHYKLRVETDAVLTCSGDPEGLAQVISDIRRRSWWSRMAMRDSRGSTAPVSACRRRSIPCCSPVRLSVRSTSLGASAFV